MKSCVHPCTAAACALLSACALQSLTAQAAAPALSVPQTVAAAEPQAKPCTWTDGNWDTDPTAGSNIVIKFTTEGKIFDFSGLPGLGAVTVEGPAAGTLTGEAPACQSLTINTDLAVTVPQLNASGEFVTIGKGKTVSLKVDDKGETLQRSIDGGNVSITGGLLTMKNKSSKYFYLNGTTLEIHGNGIQFVFPILTNASLRFCGEKSQAFHSYGWINLNGECVIDSAQDVTLYKNNGKSDAPSFEGSGTLIKKGKGNLTFDFVNPDVSRSFNIEIQEGRLITKNSGTLWGKMSGSGVFQVSSGTVTLSAPTDTKLTVDKGATICCKLTPEQVRDGYLLPTGSKINGTVEFCDPDGTKLSGNNNGVDKPNSEKRFDVDMKDGKWPEAISFPSGMEHLILSYTPPQTEPVTVTIPDGASFGELKTFTIQGVDDVILNTTSEKLKCKVILWDKCLSMKPASLACAVRPFNIPENKRLILTEGGELNSTSPISGKGTLVVGNGTVNATVTGTGLNGAAAPAPVEIAKGATLNLTVTGTKPTSGKDFRIVMPGTVTGAGTLRLTAKGTSDICNGPVNPVDFSNFTGTLAVVAEQGNAIRLNVNGNLFKFPEEAGAMTVQLSGNRSQLIFTNQSTFTPNLTLDCGKTNDGYSETGGTFGALRISCDTKFVGTVSVKEGTEARIGGNNSNKTFSGEVQGRGTLIFGQINSKEDTSTNLVTRFEKPVMPNLILRNNGSDGYTRVIAEQGGLGNVDVVEPFGNVGLVVGQAEKVEKVGGTVQVLSGASFGGAGVINKLQLEEGAVLDATRGAPTVNDSVTLPDTVKVKKSSANSVAPVLAVKKEEVRKGLLKKAATVQVGDTIVDGSDYRLCADSDSDTALRVLPVVSFNGAQGTLPSAAVQKIAELNGGDMPTSLTATRCGGSEKMTAGQISDVLTVFDDVVAFTENGTAAELSYDFGIESMKPMTGNDGKRYILLAAKVSGANGKAAAYAEGADVRVVDEKETAVEGAEACDAQGEPLVPADAAAAGSNGVRWFRVPLSDNLRLKVQAVRTL